MGCMMHTSGVSTGEDGETHPPEFGEEGTPMYLSPQILGRHRAIEYSATFDDAK